MGKEPFYFKSYERVVGIAHDVRELLREMRRLSVEDRACVEYHLREGHITQWLEYLGERELANEFKNVKDVDSAIRILEAHLLVANLPPATSYISRRRSRGG
jgi:hypothetical protein